MSEPVRQTDDSAPTPASPPKTSHWRGAGPWQFICLILVVALIISLRRPQPTTPAPSNTGLEHSFWILGHSETSAKDRYDAFLKLVAAGNTEWRSAHLFGLNLEGAWLPGANLEGADFTTANLARATFAGARLPKCNLQKTDLTEANVTDGQLANTDFYRAKLDHAKFLKANLRGAGLQEVQAQNADFSSADLTDAFLLMANLTEANFTGANLSGVSLEATILKRANLFLTQLAGVNLKDTDFTDANWWRARGLTSGQIAMLRKKFPPSEKAPASLREDYQDWLKTQPEMRSGTGY